MTVSIPRRSHENHRTYSSVSNVPRRARWRDHINPGSSDYLHKLLRNRIYLGELSHKGSWFPGAHPAILDHGLWGQVHEVLAKDPHARAGASGIAKSGSDIARKEGLHHSCINELMRLTLLAPDIIAQLMAGRQPRRLTLMWFQRNPLPVDWQAQRDIIASFE
jgi:hypothetical protein